MDKAREMIEGIIAKNSWNLIHYSERMDAADDILAAMPEIIKGMVQPLPLLERRNGYWGGKCSGGYQVAHTCGSTFRVRLNDKVICKNVKGFERAVQWANAHNRATILKALGMGEGE